MTSNHEALDSDEIVPQRATRSLLAVLALLEPIEEDFPPIEELPLERVEL